MSNSLSLSRWISLAGCALMIAVGAFLQARVHLNHDVAWILHGARWMLAGADFGRDIIDVNPPMMWFVSMPAAWLVNAGLCSEATAIRLYVWLLCVASLLLCLRLLRPMRTQGAAAESVALLIGAAYAMAVLAGGAFAQREHLAFVLGLPYCLLIAGRLRGDEPAPRVLGIACGVLAGVAFGFKPWFLAVAVLSELAYLWKVRALRAMVRTETIALATTLVAYLLAVVLFAREYLTDVVPMGVATYWAYDGSLPGWVHWRTAAMGFLVALVFLAMARRFPAHAVALGLAFAGFSFSHWAQHKGFLYHAYPALACAVTLLTYAMVLAARSAARVRWKVASWVKVGMAAVPVMVTLHCVRVSFMPVYDWANAYDMSEGAEGSFRSELIARINATVPQGGFVYAFSSHPFPAFPTMSYTAAEWASPMVAQFAMPALVARDKLRDPRKLEALDRAVRAQREQVLLDFQRRQPAMVLVTSGRYRLGMHGRDFDDIAFYTSDPRFAAIWAQYTETKAIGEIRVFLRKPPADREAPTPMR